MRLEEFQTLDEAERYIVLIENGTLTGERETDTYKFILYQLDGFYVELRLAKSNLRESMRVFKPATHSAMSV
jgi:hypothetical protein